MRISKTLLAASLVSMFLLTACNEDSKHEDNPSFQPPEKGLQGPVVQLYKVTVTADGCREFSVAEEFMAEARERRPGSGRPNDKTMQSDTDMMALCIAAMNPMKNDDEDKKEVETKEEDDATSFVCLNKDEAQKIIASLTPCEG